MPDFMKPEIEKNEKKKKTSNAIKLLKPVEMQVGKHQTRPESLKTFQPS